MSRPFANYQGKQTFAEFNEPLDANEYISNKKAMYTFCNPNICHPNKNIGSQNNYLLLKRANTLKYYQYVNTIDKTQLYINLITNLNLSIGETPIISDLSGNFPVNISPNVSNNISYNVDPSGVLFGTTPCGIMNFENFIQYESPYNNNNI